MVGESALFLSLISLERIVNFYINKVIASISVIMAVIVYGPKLAPFLPRFTAVFL